MRSKTRFEWTAQAVGRGALFEGGSGVNGGVAEEGCDGSRCMCVASVEGGCGRGRRLKVMVYRLTGWWKRSVE